jgi:hypothetical protein
VLSWLAFVRLAFCFSTIDSCIILQHNTSAYEEIVKVYFWRGDLDFLDVKIMSKMVLFCQRIVNPTNHVAFLKRSHYDLTFCS